MPSNRKPPDDLIFPELFSSELSGGEYNKYVSKLLCSENAPVEKVRAKVVKFRYSNSDGEGILLLRNKHLGVNLILDSYSIKLVIPDSSIISYRTKIVSKSLLGDPVENRKLISAETLRGGKNGKD